MKCSAYGKGALAAKREILCPEFRNFSFLFCNEKVSAVKVKTNWAAFLNNKVGQTNYKVEQIL